MNAALRRSLAFLREHPRTSPRSFAMVMWPEAWGKGGRALHGASGNAAQRLRAAAKAGYAHVAIEQGEETYEISARGRDALGPHGGIPGPEGPEGFCKRRT